MKDLRLSLGLRLSDCFLGLIFSHEDGGSTLPINVGELPPHYTHFRRYCITFHDYETWGSIKAGAFLE
jgi:hypothetical protein